MDFKSKLMKSATAWFHSVGWLLPELLHSIRKIKVTLSFCSPMAALFLFFLRCDLVLITSYEKEASPDPKRSHRVEQFFFEISLSAKILG